MRPSLPPAPTDDAPAASAGADEETGKDDAFPNALTQSDSEKTRERNHKAEERGEVRSFPIFAVGIAIGMLIFGCVGVSYGTQLVPPTEQENFMRATHMYTKIAKGSGRCCSVSLPFCCPAVPLSCVVVVIALLL